jgi:hypothetical protein
LIKSPSIEHRWGSAGGLRSDICECFADLILRQRLVDRFIQTRNDFGRRAALCDKTNPVLTWRHEIGKSLLRYGRYVQQRRDGLWCSYGKRAKPSSSYEAYDGWRAVKCKVGCAVEKIGNALLPLLVGNKRGTNARLQLEHFPEKMIPTP